MISKLALSALLIAGLLTLTACDKSIHEVHLPASLESAR